MKKEKPGGLEADDTAQGGVPPAFSAAAGLQLYLIVLYLFIGIYMSI